MTDPMSAEFDTLAGWTADVAMELGREYYVPAGCRGSGSPAALDWLVAELRPDARTRMLDCGAGVGGPAGYAREQVGVRPVLVEPEAGACNASRQLFALPVVQGDATALPFRDNSFDTAWSLGVLCTTTEQLSLVRELRRVLVLGGTLGLLVFVARDSDIEGQPAGNNFPTRQGVFDTLHDAGFEVLATAAVADLPPPPEQWQRRTRQIEEIIDARHSAHEALRTAKEQEAAISDLFATGQVSGQLMSLRTRPASG